MPSVSGVRSRRAALLAMAALCCLPFLAGPRPAFGGDAARPPLVLRAQGSFFVGGEDRFFPYTSAVETPPPGVFAPGQVRVNQMYVHYQIPAVRDARRSPSWIMVHGAAHSGATFESTPDGREGWNDDFLRHGQAVYIVDQVARARSGFDLSPLALARRTGDASLVPNVLIFPQETAWTAFRLGPVPGTAYSDTQFPIEAAGAYFAQLVPEFRAPLIADDRLNVEALAKLLDRTGPAIVLTHSQSGLYGWDTALKRPDAVKGIVAVEPRDCALPAGDVAVLARRPILIVFGDHVQESANWLPVFKACQAFVAQLQAQGGRARLLSLPELGLRGNTHMMMLDRNNLLVARLIREWMLRALEDGR